MKIDYSAKKMIIFDLDGTLAESKATIDEEMHALLEKLLLKKDVLVISGGRWQQFENQLLNHLNLTSHTLSNLFIAPAGGSSMYRFIEGEIHEMYADILSKEERERIINAFDYALPQAGFVTPEHPYGPIIEDRLSEITFSALGQKAPIEEKEKWDPDHTKRLEIVRYLKEKLPEFEIHIGGTTSVDILKKDEDKAYGVRQASERLGIPITEMVYVGDALYKDGNDEPVKKSGVEWVQVTNVSETKKLIQEILES